MTPESPSQETEPLLRTRRSGIRPRNSPGTIKRLTSAIDPRRGDLALLLCYVATGLLDSSAIYTWGSFISMQTGNTVYLGLGLARAGEGSRWIKSGISIMSFCLGSAAFASFHRAFQPLQRWVLCSSFSLQVVCIATANLVLSRTDTDSGKDVMAEDWRHFLPLALLAFQSGGQAVASRVLNFNGLTSVVLTSIYCDLFSYSDLLSLRGFGRAEERQRVAAIICLLAGATLGGVFAACPVGVAGTLWSAALLKSILAVAWVFWKGEKPVAEEA